MKTLNSGHLIIFKFGTLPLELPNVFLWSILAKGFSEIQQKGFYNYIIRDYGGRAMGHLFRSLQVLTISLECWSTGVTKSEGFRFYL